MTNSNGHKAQSFSHDEQTTDGAFSKQRYEQILLLNSPGQDKFG